MAVVDAIIADFALRDPGRQGKCRDLVAINDLENRLGRPPALPSAREPQSRPRCRPALEALQALTAPMSRSPTSGLAATFAKPDTYPASRPGAGPSPCGGGPGRLTQENTKPRTNFHEDQFTASSAFPLNSRRKVRECDKDRGGHSLGLGDRRITAITCRLIPDTRAGHAVAEGAAKAGAGKTFWSAAHLPTALMNITRDFRAFLDRSPKRDSFITDITKSLAITGFAGSFCSNSHGSKTIRSHLPQAQDRQFSIREVLIGVSASYWNLVASKEIKLFPQVGTRRDRATPANFEAAMNMYLHPDSSICRRATKQIAHNPGNSSVQSFEVWQAVADRPCVRCAVWVLVSRADARWATRQLAKPKNGKLFLDCCDAATVDLVRRKFVRCRCLIAKDHH